MWKSIALACKILLANARIVIIINFFTVRSNLVTCHQLFLVWRAMVMLQEGRMDVFDGSGENRDLRGQFLDMCISPGILNYGWFAGFVKRW